MAPGARRSPHPLDLFPVGGEGSSLDVEAHGVERHARHQTVANSTYDAGVFKRGSVGCARLSVVARAPIFTAKRRPLSAISTGGRYSSRGFFGDGSSPRPDASPAGSSISTTRAGGPSAFFVRAAQARQNRPKGRFPTSFGRHQPQRVINPPASETASRDKSTACDEKAA